jgi:hypothetical protein
LPRALNLVDHHQTPSDYLSRRNMDELVILEEQPTDNATQINPRALQTSAIKIRRTQRSALARSGHVN